MMNINQSVDFDFLTNLYSRSYCLEYIGMLIEDKREFSVFYIDLNNFSIVNDIYGHDLGDRVLKEVAKRFKSLEREDLLFARFGGDEFIGVYQSIDKDKINDLGKTIDKLLEDHIIVSESEFTIAVSVGVARHPLDSDNIEDLLKLSDIAMYKAKELGVPGEYLISEELTKKLALRKKIESLLKDIDIEKDLFLEYQPI